MPCHDGTLRKMKQMALRKEKREKFHHDGYCYSTLGLEVQAGLVDFLYKYVRDDFLVKYFTVGLIKIYQYGMIIRSDAY